jgi:hypothetical protein
MEVADGKQVVCGKSSLFHNGAAVDGIVFSTWNCPVCETDHRSIYRQSRGFAFVEMATSEEAQKAIAALHGSELGGRTLVVNEARPQEKRPIGSGGGGGSDRGRW